MRKRKELGVEANANLLVNESLDCIMQAGKTRLRPVLLTSITTILGLIPLASGFNIDFEGMLREFKLNIYFGGSTAAFWGSMSWTIIFGLIFATFLTLIIIPSMYHMLYKVKLWGIRIFKKNEQGSNA